MYESVRPRVPLTARLQPSYARVLAWRSSSIVLLLCLLTLGCNKLTLTRVNSAEQKPNNVYVFFTVEDDEEPVGGLGASDFEIYEDGKLVSAFESLQVILNPEVAAVSYTLLLLDMSGSVSMSESSGRLVDAALSFSERVGKTQKVGVYAFDGSEDIHAIVPFTETKDNVDAGITKLREYVPQDPSTNLHGAVVKGLEALQTALDKDEKPLKFGTLVVFTDGTDRAARVSVEEMSAAMDKEEYEHYEMYAVGVGEEIDQKTLDMIGADGSEKVDDHEKIREAFDRIAERIEKHMHRFYLLSYCTPSRKGEHNVRIVAKTGGEQEVSSNWRVDTTETDDSESWYRDDANEEEDEKAKKKRKKLEKKKARKKKGAAKEKKGSLEYTFSADGFGPPPACNPAGKPSFKLDAPQEPADEDESGEKPTKDQSQAKGPQKKTVKAQGAASTK